MKNLRKNFIFLIFGFLISLNILAGIIILDLNKAKFLEVIVFNVGQGDAIFVETPKRQQILIDGGPDSIILEKLAEEMPFWDRTIDLVILTHPEKDHFRGLLEVLKNYQVENILWTGVVRDTSEFKEWERLIKEEGAEIKIAQAGQRVFCSKCHFEHWVLEILYPFENLESQELKDSNNTSIVSKLVFNENSFLFTGDIYKSAEKELIGRANLNADVLKVSHHGSKTSSSEEFVEKVLLEIAVISAGKGNSYGHPHQEVLDILKSYGIKILRTDESGDIKIISDGEEIKIK